MIGQTVAIFVDAYRELNAKRLFWVTLVISAAFIGAFALVGVTPSGISVLKWKFDVPMASFAYRWVFDFVIVGIWASWAAVILALVSTSGVFPDLMSGGAIDLYLSKPISRLRLFLTKYASGLLFVLLQTSVFSTIAFLVMGTRAHEWRPSVFLIVPLVTCMFSYLFAISVLLGVVTRSSIAAVLLTVLVWGFFFLVSWSENQILQAKLWMSREAQLYEQAVANLDRQIAEAGDKATFDTGFGVKTGLLRVRRDRAVKDEAERRSQAETLETVHKIFFHVATVVPKTSQTVNVLSRKLFTDEEIDETTGGPPRNSPVLRGARPRRGGGGGGGDDDVLDRGQRADAIRDAAVEGKLALRDRSLSWVIGTSLAFEAIVLMIAAWVFCRRDY
jgi:hypothetical protein